MKNGSLALFSLAFVAAPLLGATDHIVGTAADDDSPNSLRALVAACENGDRILIPAGMTARVDRVISCAKKVDFVGLGAPAACVIQGAGTNQLFYIENSGATNVFANLTIRNGWSTGANSAGAIMSGDSHQFLLVTNCVIEGNAGVTGGAIRPGSRRSVMVDCVFRNNHATSEGGAMFPTGPTELYGCVFWSNSVPAGRPAGAISMMNWGSTTLYAKDCVFTNNIAGSSGAILLQRQATIEDCLFVDNFSDTGTPGALKVAATSGSPAIRRTRFIANQGGGGAALELNTHVLLEDCVFENNVARQVNNWLMGGAIYQRGRDRTNTFVRTVFRGNRSVNHSTYNEGNVGVMYTYPGDSGVFFIRDCLFVDNFAQIDNGSIRSNGTMFMENCVFTGNTSGRDVAAISNHGHLEATNCLFIGNAADRDVATIRNLGSMVLANSAFIGNTAGNDIMRFQNDGNADRPASLVNCTFHGNTTRGRSVVYGQTAGDPVALVNCTITSNAMASGSAIQLNYGMAGVSRFAMTNCVVTENHNLNNKTVDDVSQGVISMRNCVFSEAESGFTKMTNSTAAYIGNIWSATPAQTKLAPPAENGAERLPPDGSFLPTCAFGIGSVLRDAGAEIGAEVAADARGFPRRDRWRGLIDIGAYEFQPEWATLIMAR